jgi:S-adenosylmethionine:tRNA ribosyltransferase-isomerase
LKLSLFDFDLPEQQIAQRPAHERDESRLMVVDHARKSMEHRVFRELPEILGAEHFIVMNNTKVFPARLRASRSGRGDSIELLLVREEVPGEWIALVKPGKKALVGQSLKVGGAEVLVTAIRPDGSRLIKVEDRARFHEIIDLIGEPPLPPYIRREAKESLAEDRIRYQTVYAKRSGSIAAPTAGLHFTPEIIKNIGLKGINRCEILLHVGPGTFQPVRCEEIEEHRLEPEYFEIEDGVAETIGREKTAGKKLVAVGTTTTRTLESWIRRKGEPWKGASGFCDLFIYPGFEFKAVDVLLTNFHLPRSTLFMLVCALAGRDFMLECYREAVRTGYRFFSYGDCMIIV